MTFMQDQTKVIPSKDKTDFVCYRTESVSLVSLSD